MIIDADGHTHIPHEVFDNYMEKEFYRQRPRYGFYVDHILDSFGAVFLIGGLGLSGYMTGTVAMALIVSRVRR